MVKQPRKSASVPSLTDPALRELVAKTVENYDLSSSSAWSDLDELSSHTILERVEVDPEGVLIESGGKFKGVMNVYVTLQYDRAKMVLRQPTRS